MAIRRPPGPELVTVAALAKGDLFVSPTSGLTLEVAYSRPIRDGVAHFDVRTPTGVASVVVDASTVVSRLTVRGAQ